MHPAPDTNSINAVLYALSTIAQTCAALAALVGAVALYKLQAMREAHDAVGRTIQDILTPNFGRHNLPTVAEAIRLARVNLSAERPGIGQGTLDQVRPELGRWDGFDARYAQERLISLAVALEALFSPDDKQELSVRISLTAALFLGGDRSVAREIAPFIARIYGARSDLMHRGENPFDPARGSKGLGEADLRRLAGYVREGILRVLTLDARDEFRGSRDDFLKRLLAAILDDDALARLRDRSDWELYLREKSYGKGPAGGAP